MATIDKATAVQRITEARRLLNMGLNGVEAAYRAALAADPGATPAATELADFLCAHGRADEAVALLRPMTAGQTSHAVLAAYAEALKAAGRLEPALEVSRRAARENPASAVASHNVAGVLGDLERFDEAETMARRAMAAGLDAPQTWMILARALQGNGKLSESEVAFRTAVAKNPVDPDAQRELAQLLWMTSGDQARALSVLDQTLAQLGTHPRLLEVKAIAAKFTGDLPLALATIEQAAGLHPRDPAVLIAATHLAILAGDPVKALGHAREAALAAPDSRWARLNLCEALLANGEGRQAAAIAEALSKQEPLAQDVLAYLDTAWRLTGDPRHAELYDYDTLVQVGELDAPEGWSSLPAFLSDLKAALEERHLFRTHPFQQSVLNGSQMNNLIASGDPTIQALQAALAGPIARTLAALGAGADPVRSRNTGQAGFQGMWSVRLQSGGGRHQNHIHPKGWLSSACYIDLPPDMGGDDRQGWLTFGEPGLVTQPPLGPEWFVEPRPGRLVLFPSYMWHGTLPFSGQGHRLSIAFDLMPKGGIAP